MRPLDPADKSIWISDPVWWDEEQPSARDFYIHFLQLAHEKFAGQAMPNMTVIPTHTN